MISTSRVHEQSGLTSCERSALNPPGIPWNYLRIRRVAELLLILIAAPALVLLMLCAALLIWIEDRRQVFFIQERPGQNGKIFRLYKFRSMYQGSDTKLIHGEKDSRITKIGHYLRKYKIDELPQFLNVVKGDMSIIGPRPVPIHYYKLYRELIQDYDLRHIIPPGITGLAGN
jgi:lipopolysaccharide/colanic/teichoic acid biosynthesis glycosyltransferase